MAVLVVLVSTALIVSACAAGYPDYGQVRTSREVTDMFEQKKLPADYRYYYIGPDSQPDVVIGIAPGYTLRTRLWKPVDLTPDVLNQWLRTMTGGLGGGSGMWGASLEDKDGKRVGLWYSSHETTSVKVTANKEVTVNSPLPKLMDDDSPFSPRNKELYAP